LGAKTLCRRDQAIIVIGHVDDRGDTACRGAASRPDEVLLPQLAAAVYLRVDGPRQHDKANAAVLLARRRGAGTDSLHLAVANENVTVVDHAIGEDNRACKNLIS